MSLLAADVNKATVNLIHDLNKTLRFAKSLAADAVVMSRIAMKLEDVCFIFYLDAAFAVRSDQSSRWLHHLDGSQGPKEALDGKSVRYNLLSWRSVKLTRVCRSSLGAEAHKLVLRLWMR